MKHLPTLEDLQLAPGEETAVIDSLYRKAMEALKKRNLAAAQISTADLIDAFAQERRQPSPKAQWLIDFVLILT